MTGSVLHSLLGAWSGSERATQRYRSTWIAFAILVALCTWTTGCSSPTDAPTSPAGTSILSGTVEAFASTTADHLDPSGIEVELQGTSFQAFADHEGHFRIAKIPAGVYTILFSKPGFDSMIYPVHHLVGAGNDIINDAFLIRESDDSILLRPLSAVFTVSIKKTIRIIDTIITDSAGISDTTILSHDSVSITYDTVQNASALVVSGMLKGTAAPADLFVYSSLDSTLWPEASSPENSGQSVDSWLREHLRDATFKNALQSPPIANGTFMDTLSEDVLRRTPYSLPAGEVVYIYVVAHSNLSGLPDLNGEYRHYFTAPYGAQIVRFRYVVP